MIIITVIFFIAIIHAFYLLAFRAWELRTGRVHSSVEEAKYVPHIPFRQIEKKMLYLAKRVVQGLVLIIAKYWYISTTKGKKWTEDRWPKVYAFFKRKAKSPEGARSSFFHRAVLESKIKIRRIKERVKREHE